MGPEVWSLVEALDAPMAAGKRAAALQQLATFQKQATAAHAELCLAQLAGPRSAAPAYTGVFAAIALHRFARRGAVAAAALLAAAGRAPGPGDAEPQEGAAVRRSLARAAAAALVRESPETAVDVALALAPADLQDAVLAELPTEIDAARHKEIARAALAAKVEFHSTRGL